jgi:iron-sulfur cluster insertion protein
MIMLILTNAAAAKLSLKLCNTTNNSPSLTFHETESNVSENKSRFRIKVIGGGCAGYQYKFSIDNSLEGDDILFRSPEAEFELVIDKHSVPLLKGTTLDHTSSLAGESFFLTNPNAKMSCGCGSSFSV